MLEVPPSNKAQIPSAAAAAASSSSSLSSKEPSCTNGHSPQRQQEQIETRSLFSADSPFAQSDSAAQVQVSEDVRQSSSQRNGNSNTSLTATTSKGFAGSSPNSSLKNGLGLPALDVESAAATADTSTSSLTPYPSVITHHCRTPSDAGLRLETSSNALNPYPTKNPLSMTSSTAMEVSSPSADSTQCAYQGVSGITNHHNPALKSAMSAASFASSMSPRSALSSPSLHALTDLTPLPSPLLTAESPGPWRRSTMRPTSSGSACSLHKELFTLSATSQTKKQSPPPRKRKPKSYGVLVQTPPSEGSVGKSEYVISRARSTSESVPEISRSIRPRHVTISGGQKTSAGTDTDAHPRIQREDNLAVQRGLAQNSVDIGSSKLPSPPSSNRSVTESEDGEEDLVETERNVNHLSVSYGPSKRRKVWRQIREIGHGTFSKVVLATNQKLKSTEPVSEDSVDSSSLVAIKIIQHGPAGGADEDRIALSLKREVEIMKSIHHPSVISLRAFEFDASPALLVLNYCPGGDLFTLASEHRLLLTPNLLQRMFAELVAAVRHLHANLIVHRDIKLENVLLNVRPATIKTILSFTDYPHALITLTDLGLSRRIPAPPASPLLTTRCGSEDYAAPELILGQQYDGRATDAWALGVLLYALMEGRLPFDQQPANSDSSRSGASKTPHRIARCEWYWWKHGDSEGSWDPKKEGSQLWQGPREVVEGLLKKLSRGRMSLDQVAEVKWVAEGINVPGGYSQMGDATADTDVADAGISEENG